MVTSILFKLAGWLGGGVFETLIGRVADLLRQKASDDLARFQTGVQADTQIALAQVTAQIETRKLPGADDGRGSRLVGDSLDPAADRLSMRAAFWGDRAGLDVRVRLGDRQIAGAL